MTETPKNPNSLAELRRRAEAKVESDDDLHSMPAEDVRKLVHELRTHQIELEMQNEELRRAQEELADARDRYSDLYDFAPVGYLTVSEKGLIRQANLTAADILGVERGKLVNRRFSEFVLAEDEDTYYRHRRELERTGLQQSCELRLQPKDGDPIWVEIVSRLDTNTGGSGGHIVRSTLSDITERKAAEAKLRESESNYHQIFDNCTDAIFIHDAETGVIVDVSETTCRLFGYDADEFGRLDVGDLSVNVPPYTQAEAVEWIRKASEEGPQCFQWLAKSKDGRLIWFENNLMRASIAGRDRILVFGREITEQKQVQDALAESERYHRSLLYSMHEDIVVLDRDYRITDLNNGASVTTGLTREQMLGRHCFEVFHNHSEPCDRRGEQCGLQRVFSTGLPLNCHHQHLRSDGSVVDVDILLSPLKDAHGNVTHVIESKRDVTDLFEAQRELEASEERYRILFESSQDAIMTVVPPSWGFTSGNGACIKLFGARDEAEFISCTPWELSPEYQPDGRPSAEKAKEMMEAAMRQGAKFFEWTHKRLDGIEFPASVLVTRMEIDGQVLLQATVRDLTEQKLLEEKFRQSQKMQAIGHLAGGVAHDFRNQLTVIVGWSHILQQELACDKDRREMIDQILQAAERSTVMTGHLLAFSRKDILRPAVSDIVQLTVDLRKTLDRMVREDIGVTFVLSETPCRANVDTVQFHQALMNLVVNACDAMPGGGELTVESRLAELQESDVGHDPELKPGRFVEVRVVDTGTGMDEATRSQVFDPFFTTKEVGKGTGLGLSMVYGFARQSGGFVTCHSRLGEGTQFSLYFPAVSDEVTKKEPDVGKRKTPTGTETILVAEDALAVRQLLTRMLQKIGYTVLEASDGTEAIQIADEYDGPIDMLVTDVLMPKMGGAELADRLRGTRPNLAVLYVSGYAGNELENRGVMEGRKTFLTKPFDRQQLGARVRELLDVR